MSDVIIDFTEKKFKTTEELTKLI